MNTIQSGNRTQLTGAKAINPDLETGFYDIGYDPMSGYFLEHRPAFKLPSKIYGDCSEFSGRVLKTFKAINRGMSTLLSGPKGCGKTLTAKRICLDAQMPVICINGQHAGEGFKTFLSNIPNPCVVFIDEFEKLYSDEDAKAQMLGLLDGTTHNKHLFLLTSNLADVGQYFNNRPGRVRYHKQFDEFPEEALHKMIDDKVKNKKLNTALHKYIDTTGTMSPDVMSCLIEECLIHNQTPDQFSDIINIQAVDDSPYSAIIMFKKLEAKKELNDDESDKAYKYLSYIKARKRSQDNYRKVYPDIDSYVQFIEENTYEYRSSFCRPFADIEDEGTISICYAHCQEINDSESFYVKKEDIKEMFKTKNGVFIKTDKYEITMTKSKSKFKFTL